MDRRRRWRALKERSAFYKLVATADTWYDAKDFTTVGQQTLPNRGTGTNTLQRGSTDGVDTNDPLVALWDGTDYVRLPGTTGNSVTFPRPFATTHFTILRAGDSTITGTTTADPVVIGGTAHSGSVTSVVLRETDAAGAVGGTLDPSDLTGWTVNRSSSGLKTAVVTRPVMLFDGTDDYLQTTDTPTYTHLAGKHTVVIMFAPGGSTDYRVLYSTESAIRDGMRIISLTEGGDISIEVSGADIGYGLTLNPLSNGTSLDRVVIAAVVDEGVLRGWSNVEGMTADISMAPAGTITHLAARLGANAYDTGSAVDNEVFAVLIFSGEVLTEAELDLISAKLRAGDYA